MANKLSVAALALIFALFSDGVTAQSGFYVSGAFGSSDSDVALGGINRVDGDDSSYALSVGYAFNRNVSVEAAYQDLGTHNGETNCPPGFACLFIPLMTRAQLTGISLSFIGSYPLSERLDVYGKVGLLSWDVDFEGISSAFNDSGEDLLYGMGLNWSIDGQWKVFVEYQRADLDVDIASIGLRHQF
jgi:OOP family OmpA-OmpF porin